MLYCYQKPYRGNKPPTNPRHGKKEGEILLSSDMELILSAWIKTSTPFFSGMIRIVVFAAILVIMRITYNELSRLITRIAGI